MKSGGDGGVDDGAAAVGKVDTSQVPAMDSLAACCDVIGDEQVSAVHQSANISRLCFIDRTFNMTKLSLYWEVKWTENAKRRPSICSRSMTQKLCEYSEQFDSRVSEKPNLCLRWRHR